eukprot:CAMPEP_0196592256 /NCGR_PEP_ID=MMETSP1081-20130531/72219_1 /TAXON_ID=36882 /ORGANISM="Pyramimonas amylifera, Strain CCMP720" /LENGTH=97 /DNA_ID=CAMNT_0041915873 /DNA_START=120 /DNA_END=410 /DNA_ORIENTATION=-
MSNLLEVKYSENLRRASGEVMRKNSDGVNLQHKVLTELFPDYLGWDKPSTPEQQEMLPLNFNPSSGKATNIFSLIHFAHKWQKKIQKRYKMARRGSV